jgi:hypothetical protein
MLASSTVATSGNIVVLGRLRSSVFIGRFLTK